MALVDAWSPAPAPSGRPVVPVALAPDPGTVEGLLRAVRIRARASNEPIVIEHIPAPLRLLGSGTDAVVVQHPALPDQAFKIYAPETIGCLADEYRAYGQLADSPYFAACLGRGASYLVLSYEHGPTLYECLVQGIPIPEQAMADVEAARHLARQLGLHPKDIHLKNVLLQGDRARIVDVSKYVAPGDADPVWIIWPRATAASTRSSGGGASLSGSSRWSSAATGRNPRISSRSTSSGPRCS